MDAQCTAHLEVGTAASDRSSAYLGQNPVNPKCPNKRMKGEGKEELIYIESK
jgi:hypothetical protein